MINRNSLISIIVPVYNVQSYIRECFDSLLGQSHQAFEVLVVDDGSTDSSGKICDEYAAADERFRVWHTDNRGIGNARNFALRNVRGEYVFFLDPDDVLEDFSLAYLLDCMNRHGADIALGVSMNFKGEWSDRPVTPRAVFGDDPGSYSEYPYRGHKAIIEDVVFDKRDFQTLENRRRPPHVNFEFFSSLYRTSILKENDIQFLTISYGEDTYVMVRYLLCSDCAVTSSLPVYWHRRNPTSTSFQYHPNYLAETKVYVKSYEELFQKEAVDYLPRMMKALGAAYFSRCTAAIERELTMSPRNKPNSEKVATLKEIRNDETFKSLFTLENMKYTQAGKMRAMFLLVWLRMYSLPVFLFDQRRNR